MKKTQKNKVTPIDVLKLNKVIAVSGLTDQTNTLSIMSLIKMFDPTKRDTGFRKGRKKFKKVKSDKNKTLLQVECPKCKGLVCKTRLPSCVDWCKKAGECVGEAKWKQLQGGKSGSKEITENN